MMNPLLLVKSSSVPSGTPGNYASETSAKKGPPARFSETGTRLTPKGGGANRLTLPWKGLPAPDEAPADVGRHLRPVGQTRLVRGVESSSVWS